MVRILTVIVNYRTAGLTEACLVSLAATGAAAAGLRVAVVDNNSGDGSAERLQSLIAARGWGEWARVLPRPDNDGFAAGNNAPIKADLQSAAPADYYWLLNPDTVVRQGAVAELVRFLECNPRAGLAGSRLEDPDGSPQRSAFRFPGAISEFERAMRFGPVSRLASRFLTAPPVRDEAHRTGWVAGASVLVRRAVFDSIGLLDSGYFLYYEEVDFCRRAVDAGWECWYVPSSRVVHLVGQSSGIDSRAVAPRRVPRYWFASRRRYFEKHRGWVGARAADLAWACGFVLWRLRRLVQRKPDDDPPCLFWDFMRCNFLPQRGAR